MSDPIRRTLLLLLLLLQFQLGKTEGISPDLDLVCKNILWTLAFGWGKVTLPDKRACV